MKIIKLENRVSDVVMRMLDTRPLTQLYDIGGFIAGGFARMCALGNMESNKDVVEYLTGRWPPLKMPLKNRWQVRAGDIDVFFPTIEQGGSNSDTISEAMKQQPTDVWSRNMSMGPSKSITGLCLNTEMGKDICQCLGHDELQYATIQCIVDASLRGTPERVISGFDLVNCRAALMRDGTILVDERLLSIESNSQLLVDRVNSPMLMKRILKYLNNRGLTTVHSGSRPFIVDWIARHVSESSFGTCEALEKMTAGMRLSSNELKQLVDSSALNAHDLVMLIGRYVETKWSSANGNNGYVSVNLGTVDVALELIGEANKNEAH